MPRGIKTTKTTSRKITNRTTNRSTNPSAPAQTWRNEMSRLYTQMREKVHAAPEAGIAPPIVTEAALVLASMADVLLRIGVSSGVSRVIATAEPAPAIGTTGNTKISRIPPRATGRKTTTSSSQSQRRRFRLRASEKQRGLTEAQAHAERIAAGERNVAPLPKQMAA